MAMKFTPVQGPNGPFVSLGDLTGRMYDCVCDSSYPNTANDTTSGYKVAGQIGLGTILGGEFIGPSTANAMGMLPRFRTDTGYLRVFYPTGGVAPASIAQPIVTPGNNGNNGNNSTLGGNTSTLTAGNGTEVANATNCATLTFRFMFIGY